MERPGLRSRVEPREGIAAGGESAPVSDRLNELPRRFYFGVEDRRLAGRAGLEEKYLAPERSRRQRQKEHAIFKLQQVIGALKTTSAFDETGNILSALPHLADSLEDAVKLTRNFMSDVDAAVDRYGDALDELTTRDAEAAKAAMNGRHEPSATPQSPAAAVEPSPTVPATAGPKPGPGLIPSIYGDGVVLSGRFSPGGPGIASVTVFNPAASPTEELSAFDRVAADLAAFNRAANSYKAQR